MSIPDSVIEQLNEKADLVAIIKRHTDLKPNGREFKGRCPFHGEKTPSFFVNPEKNMYHCFGCGVGGNAIGFLMDFERQTFMEALKTLSDQTGIDLPKDDFTKYSYQRSNQPYTQHGNAQHRQNKSASTPNSNTNTPTNTISPSTPAPPSFGDIQPNNTQFDNQPSDNPPFYNPPFVADHHAQFDNTHFNNSQVDEQPFYGQPFERLSPNISPNLPNVIGEFDTQLDGSLHALLSAVAQFYKKSLKDNDIAYRYLLNRGLTPQTIAFFELGYAPTAWQHLEQAFPNDLEGLRLLGLIRTSQKGREFNLFRDRVMFPIKDKQGRIVGFAGRALDDETLPKYVNSSDSVVFQKNHILYGYYESRLHRAENWLVVEGYLDVISLYQAGIYGAVAPMGTAINENQIAQLLKFNDELTLCFDGDKAGQKAATRALEVAMPVLTDGKSLKFLTLPDNHDPDTYTKTHGKDKMQAAILGALSTTQYLYELMRHRYDLNLPEQKAAAMRDIRALTDKLPKGSSFRSWLNNELYQKLRGTRHQRGSLPTNYDTQQISIAEQVALCLLYRPSIAQTIDWDNEHPDDPLLAFFAEANLSNLHPAFEQKFAEANISTPKLPSWSDFCFVTYGDDNGNSYKKINALGKFIELIKQATPILLPDNDDSNAIFLLSAMGNTNAQRQLCVHWDGFCEHLKKLDNQSPDNNNLSLLFNELLYRLTHQFIKNAQLSATHLLISQLHAKRLALLDDWLRRHSLLLDRWFLAKAHQWPQSPTPAPPAKRQANGKITPTVRFVLSGANSLIWANGQAMPIKSLPKPPHLMMS